MARAVVRLGSSFLTDVPLVLIAIAGFALTLFAGASFVLVLIGGGIAFQAEFARSIYVEIGL